MDQQPREHGPYEDSPDVADEAGEWPAEGATSEQTARADDAAQAEGDPDKAPPQ